MHCEIRANAVPERLQPQARYGYYRRCQSVLRHGGQCKAPAMRGQDICHQHAAQKDMARRREASRRELMRRIALLQKQRFGANAAPFASFHSIQHAIGEVAQALIDGRIDAKVAGRLAIELQTMSRLLRMIARYGSTTERRGHGGGRASLKAPSREFPDAASVGLHPRDSSTRPHPSQLGLGLAQNDKGVRAMWAGEVQRRCRHRTQGVSDTAKKTRNHHRHLNPRGLSFSPHFLPGVWHNGIRSGVLWTLVEHLCLYGNRFSIEGRNTS